MVDYLGKCTKSGLTGRFSFHIGSLCNTGEYCRNPETQKPRNPETQKPRDVSTQACLKYFVVHRNYCNRRNIPAGWQRLQYTTSHVLSAHNKI